jgi:hypothetical protein
MSRSRVRHRLALSAILLGFTFFLAGSPAQAQENPPSGWFNLLVHELGQWLPPSWWSGHQGAGTNAISRQAKPAGFRVQAPASTSCVGPESDPDGACPH